MLVYLDSLIVIYQLDHVGPFQQRAASWIAAASAAGILLECFSSGSSVLSGVGWAPPTIFNLWWAEPTLRDLPGLTDFDDFFANPGVRQIPLTSAVFDRAAEIRAHFRFKTPDAIHLATAIEGGCDRFLTHDARLARFHGINVEILP